MLQLLKYLNLKNRQFEIQEELIKSENEINVNELEKFSKTKDFLAMNDPIFTREPNSTIFTLSKHYSKHSPKRTFRTDKN